MIGGNVPKLLKHSKQFNKVLQSQTRINIK